MLGGRATIHDERMRNLAKDRPELAARLFCNPTALKFRDLIGI